MSHTQLQTPPSRPEEVERVARDISSMARELAPEIERGRQLPDELLAHLRRSGLMRAGAPEEVGALELAPGLALRCAEEIARGDASAGWCVSIAITSSLLAAYLPAESRAELFGDADGHRSRRLGPAREGPAGRWRRRGLRPLGLLQRDHALRPPVRRLHGRGGAERARREAHAERGRDSQGRPSDPRYLAHARPARHGQPRCRRGRGVRPRPRACSRCSTGRSSTARCTAFRSSGSSRSRSAQPRWATRAEPSTSSSHWPRARSAWARPARSPSARPPTRRSPRPRRRCAPRGPRTTRRSTRPGRRPRTTEPVSVDLRNGLRLAATHAVRTLRRRRAVDV